jgi:hypothetical protein
MEMYTYVGPESIVPELDSVDSMLFALELIEHLAED